jgi:hypothetical protein
MQTHSLLSREGAGRVLHQQSEQAHHLFKTG